MDVTSALLDKSDNVAGDPSDLVQGEKKFFFSSIGKAHLINVLYGIGYTIQIAMLPYMLISSKAGIEHNGYLLTLFSLLQFLGSMFFGRLADIWGVKNSFYLSLCSSSLMYLMLPACRDTWAYYVSFLPSFFMQAFQASSLLVCLKTDSQNRTAAIGYLNLSYGMGIILGSLIAGFMVNFVGSRGNLLIALASQIVALYVAKTLNQDPKLLRPVNLGEIKIKEMFSSMQKEYIRILNLFRKTYGMCLLILFGLLPILMTKFAFAPVLVDMFKLTPSHTSYLMTYAGMLTIIAEGLLAPYLSSIGGDITCCKFSIPLTLIGFLSLSLCGANEYLVLIFMSIPLCGGALLYICGTSQMTKRVEESELGTAIGLNTSIFYAVTIVAPYFAFKSYIALGLGLYWLLCAIICFVITTYIFALDKLTLQIFNEDTDSLETMFSSVKVA
ncbi:transporter, putative [Plasmodium knowlesi strain H]|uniref:Major facilitator superfamily domain-containing protein, putative n=3 Tax=Plasmodium knowlesi TaxID=5850 RepID=B3L6A3_PLAKH|nr:major facilitator superfamily domain-containing protein, putative [Plasmodium knowlesi strain H]OTN66980.1 putative Transporter [Plasmodium knowlesi]CAA9988674.1 major facilitator superfamily domain-containing protein, putative [Plasmodium knowlesi strain H]SBO21576.1 transporter, putative [Plasmodium knowlesi strain H]VVS78148.1 major facilitator superfamily domain-containing protein, putative [Plasmodium knowlesi strain H]|eukprot:XP_002259651.1 transporter, putative [Plasmodium knowlesi strain H]